MKRILIVLLAVALTACAAPATEPPTAAPVQPTATPLVVVETVVVTVIPTQAPTEVPSATPLPPPTEVPPTAVPPTAIPPTQPPAATQAVASTGGPIAVDDALGAGWFVNMTRSRNDLSLRCQISKEIIFSVKPTDPNITQVDFFYRIQDRATGAVFDWKSAGRLIADASGNFVIVFSGDDVHPDVRKPNAWLDYQFAGSNSTGVVGRSEKIEKQVTYTFDCP